ncbi:unnamed protein product [Fraxinus pennsylvanica]|uniref:Uncharacterized protein n=1 Tax=Fraxinus pennsylvanica TaxID=56036 RepID=A0AAD2E5J2_9LAMI|nr:unnamed protein product [Fraxinus pennsylvanica]
MQIHQVVILLFVIIVGAFNVDVSNWTPFAPNGATAILTGATVVFFAYVGFDAVANSTEESKRLQEAVQFHFGFSFGELLGPGAVNHFSINSNIRSRFASQATTAIGSLFFPSASSSCFYFWGIEFPGFLHYPARVCYSNFRRGLPFRSWLTDVVFSPLRLAFSRSCPARQLV